MSRKINFFISALTLLSMVFFSSNVFSKEKVYEWKFVLDWPENDITVQKIVPKFKKWLENESNGRLKIKSYAAGQLVPAVQSFDNLRAGTFQLLATCGAYHGGKVPVANASFLLPMGPRGADDYWRLYFEYGIKNLLSDAYTEHGVKFLTITPWSGLNIISKKPLRTLEDFKGVKIRTAGLQAALWKNVGASPVFIPSGEIYLSLQQGVVEGATWSNPGIDGLKLGEVTKYMITGYPMPPGSSTSAGSGVLLANAKAFAKLPSDLQEIIQNCALKYGLLGSTLYREWDNDFFLGGDKERGMETISLPEEDTKTLRNIAMEKIWPDVSKKDKRSAQYVESVKQLLKDEGVIK